STRVRSSAASEVYKRPLDTEGRDRVSLTFPELQERLIVRLAELNRRTHVVLINGSPLEIGGWLPHAASLVEAWYPGMEGGSAVADVLFGRVNPSGRMPFTWPRRLDDAPCRRYAYEDNGTVVYGEKSQVGYRYFDTAAEEPQFTFGYGLSYTTFEYRDLAIDSTAPAGVTGHVDVANTGAMDGYETVQIYVRPLAPSVERPQHELKWFRKVFVPAGESVRVDFELGPKAFSYWDVHRGDWTVDAGAYDIEVCRDSRSVVMTAGIEIND
ncbi:MAG: glycoside hydrolase family 3 C-terminal domain-containing protein, partial [Alistipes sp.]|nr:glycoside hydrolase family 3 C-terminal domain-containing protein [Alistipes sp.]